MTPKQMRLLNYLKKVLSDINTEIQESGNEEFDNSIMITICESEYFNKNLDIFIANVSIKNIARLEANNND